MPTEGGWTVKGGESLRVLQGQLLAAGRVDLKKNMGVAIRVATAPAKTAIRNELVRVMPKAGGANTYLAKLPITTQILVGPKTAGVRLRSRRGQRLDQGYLRHPLFGDRDYWFNTQVPSGWWEQTLSAMAPKIRAELELAMAVTAREAGFTDALGAIPL